MGATSSVAQKGPDEIFSDEESRQGQKRNRCRGFSAARGSRTNADRFVRKKILNVITL